MSIDDDFDKMIRHMFEHFFKDAFGHNSKNDGIIRFGFQPSIVEEETDIDLTKEKELLVEKIDFEDSLLVIIEGYSQINGITIEVIEKTIVIDNGMNKEYIDIPYPIDIEGSGYTFRNGILEIRLSKINNKHENTVASSGILHIDN